MHRPVAAVLHWRAAASHVPYRVVVPAAADSPALELRAAPHSHQEAAAMAEPEYTGKAPPEDMRAGIDRDIGTDWDIGIDSGTPPAAVEVETHPERQRAAAAATNFRKDCRTAPQPGPQKAHR